MRHRVITVVCKRGRVHLPRQPHQWQWLTSSLPAFLSTERCLTSKMQMIKTKCCCWGISVQVESLPSWLWLQIMSGGQHQHLWHLAAVSSFYANGFYKHPFDLKWYFFRIFHSLKSPKNECKFTWTLNWDQRSPLIRATALSSSPEWLSCSDVRATATQVSLNAI